MRLDKYGKNTSQRFILYLCPYSAHTTLMMKQFLLCLWLLLLMAGHSFAAPFNYTWRIEDLAKINTGTIDLRDSKRRLLKRIDSKQMIYLYSVMQALEEVSELRSELLITDGEQPNAFATKGMAELVPTDAGGKEQTEAGTQEAGMQGRALADAKPIDEENAVEINIVGINFAMLDLLGLDVHMAAALLGHELGHLKLNHGEDHKTRRRTDIRTAGNTRYSRDNEREADYLGAIWAVEAGYDPQGAVRLQELLYKKTKHLSGGFSGSHPSSIERVTKLKSLARRLSR